MEKRTKGIFGNFRAALMRNLGRTDYISSSFCLLAKAMSLFSSDGSFSCSVEVFEFSGGVGQSLSFIFSSCLKLEMFSWSAWFW